MDPLAGSAWSASETVAGFARSAPNATLIEVAAGELRRTRSLRIIDIGCGAGRNAVPLARLGADVFGIDLSTPMLVAALARAREEALDNHVRLALAPMQAIPARDSSFDFVIAHGIWNLARSATEFRAALAEAARVARPGAAVFVFTFSRNTLAPDAAPLEGEPFVFTQFAGEPQCFLTEEQLMEELSAAQFEVDGQLPLRELNRRTGGALQAARGPVIYEGLFRKRR